MFAFVAQVVRARNRLARSRGRRAVGDEADAVRARREARLLPDRADQREYSVCRAVIGVYGVRSADRGGRRLESPRSRTLPSPTSVAMAQRLFDRHGLVDAVLVVEVDGRPQPGERGLRRRIARSDRPFTPPTAVLRPACCRWSPPRPQCRRPERWLGTTAARWRGVGVGRVQKFAPSFEGRRMVAIASASSVGPSTPTCPCSPRPSAETEGPECLGCVSP